MTEQSPDLFKLIKDGGTITVLLGGIWAFVKGHIVPRSHVDEIKEHATVQTELLATRIVQALVENQEQAIKQGIIAAVEHLNGGD